RRKAAERGLSVRFVVGPAEDPPAGPFDAVIERHVVWTLPEPAAALAVWRRAAPGGRLILLEGTWAGEGPFGRVAHSAASLLERVWSIPSHHHGAYPPDVLTRLPLASSSSPRPFLDAATAGGWRDVRVYRLRDVEWAAERASRWPLGRLRRRPRYAIVAD